MLQRSFVNSLCRTILTIASLFALAGCLPGEGQDGSEDPIAGDQSAATDSSAGGYGMGSTTLSWQPPVQNTDGTPLFDLSGYRIYWGSESGQYTESVTINNPGLTMYVVENLMAGDYYFVSTALNAAGIESDFSNEAYRSIQY